jgi:two-component system NarL family sensor kinase
VLDTAMTRYYDQFFLFIILVSVLIGVNSIVSHSMKRARESERKSRGFFYAQNREREAERRRIALELHDSVLPCMASGESEKAVARIREIFTRIMPPDFVRTSLGDALIQAGNDFTRRTGIECRVSVEPGFEAERFPVETRLHLFRMTQEALNNIEKHAHASEATVTALRTAAGFLLIIGDDGVGFDPQDDGGTGLGLRGMADRVTYIGAKLNIISSPGEGATVRIFVPAVPAGGGE